MATATELIIAFGNQLESIFNSAADIGEILNQYSGIKWLVNLQYIIYIIPLIPFYYLYKKKRSGAPLSVKEKKGWSNYIWSLGIIVGAICLTPLAIMLSLFSGGAFMVVHILVTSFIAYRTRKNRQVMWTLIFMNLFLILEEGSALFLWVTQ